MGILSNLISFVSGTIARSSEVNSNLQTIANAIPGTSASVSGSTTGTATAVCVVNNNGVIITQVFFNNFRNGSAGQQQLVLPVPYLSGAQGWNGGVGSYQVKNGSTVRTVQIQTGFNAGSDGTVSGQTVVFQNSMWHVDTAFDTLGLTGSDAGTHTGFILIVGS